MTETAWWILLSVVLLLLCASVVRYDVWWALLRDRLMPPRAADVAGGIPDEPATRAKPAAQRPHGAPHQRPAYHRSGRRS